MIWHFTHHGNSCHIRPLPKSNCINNIFVCKSRRTIKKPLQLHQQELQEGERARVHGIRSSPALNGQYGRLFTFLDAQQRCNVIMDDGSGYSLKPANVSPCSREELACSSPLHSYQVAADVLVVEQLPAAGVKRFAALEQDPSQSTTLLGAPTNSIG